MQKQPPSSFCAAAAIAAALALGSTAAQAQDAGPAPDVPTIAPPAPTAVTAAPGPAAPSAQVSNPVVQAVPAATAPEPAAQRAPVARSVARPPAAAERATPHPTASRVAAPTGVTAPAAAAPGAVTRPLAIAPPTAPAVDPAPPAETAPAARVQPQSDGLSGAEAGLLAVLAAGGLAGAGFIAARSRRKRDEDDLTETEVAPVVVPEAVARREPEFRPEPLAEQRREPTSERFATPTGAVVTGTEREELLQRMVAAAPDEANPFTSPKARRKRARLILERRAQLQQAQGAEPFDWRTYRTAETAARVGEPA